MSEQPKKEQPWWRIGGILVRAWTAGEARAEYRRHTGGRVPVGVRAVRVPAAVTAPEEVSS